MFQPSSSVNGFITPSEKQSSSLFNKHLETPNLKPSDCSPSVNPFNQILQTEIKTVIEKPKTPIDIIITVKEELESEPESLISEQTIMLIPAQAETKDAAKEDTSVKSLNALISEEDIES